MDFQPTEDQRAVEDAARRFAVERLAPYAAEWDAIKHFPKPYIALTGCDEHCTCKLAPCRHALRQDRGSLTRFCRHRLNQTLDTFCPRGLLESGKPVERAGRCGPSEGWARVRQAVTDAAPLR